MALSRIYQQASRVEKTGAGYKFTFQKPLDINNQAKKIRIITTAGNVDMELVAMPDNKTIVLKGDNVSLKEGEKVFVDGEEVNDFRAVDYEALGTLNISATQELSKEIDLLKKENMELEAKLEQLYKDNSLLKEDTTNRIEKLEASLKLLTGSLNVSR